MAYKEKHKDLRYIIRNGSKDLKLLVKRVSEGYRLPYREIKLSELGEISPIKPQCPVEEDIPNDEESDVDKQGFTKVKINKASLYRQKVPEKQQVFRNITNFLDGSSKDKDNESQ